MANHYNLVNHFLEIGVNASVQFQSHGSNAGIDRCYTLGNGCGERTKGRVTFNEPQNKFVGCSPDGVSISKTIDFDRARQVFDILKVSSIFNKVCWNS